MSGILKWYVGTQEQCEALIASTDTYYGFPSAIEKTTTWATPEQNPFDAIEWTIPFNQWMLDNLTYDPAKIVEYYPFQPAGGTGATGANE